MSTPEVDPRSGGAESPDGMIARWEMAIKQWMAERPALFRRIETLDDIQNGSVVYEACHGIYRPSSEPSEPCVWYPSIRVYEVTRKGLDMGPALADHEFRLRIENSQTGLKMYGHCFYFLFTLLEGDRLGTAFDMYTHPYSLAAGYTTTVTLSPDKLATGRFFTPKPASATDAHTTVLLGM